MLFIIASDRRYWPVLAIPCVLGLAACLTDEPESGSFELNETPAALGGEPHRPPLHASGDATGIADYNNLMQALNSEPLGATAYIRCGMVDRAVGGLTGEVVLADGDTVALEDATGSVATFEFDSDASVMPGHLGVTLPGTDPREVADALAAAINDHTYSSSNPGGLRISAQALYGDDANPGFYMATVLLTQLVPGPAGNGRAVEIDAADPWFVGQSTFQGGASGEGGGLVPLAAGNFVISRTVKIVRGDVWIQGQHGATILDAVPEDPSRRPGGGFGYAYDPYWGAGGYAMGAGHLLVSYPRNVTVEGVILRVPENQDAEGNYHGPGEWDFYDGATALNSFVLSVAGSLSGERPRIVIRDVTAIGGRGDAWAGLGPEDAVNMQYGFFVALGEDIGFAEPGQGDILYEHSTVDKGPWRGFVVGNLGRTSTAVIRDCTVRHGGDGLRFVYVDGADVRVHDNTIDLDRGFPPVWWVGAMSLVFTSGIRAHDNTVTGRSAIPLVASSDNVFTANRFVGLDPDFIFYDGPRAAFVTYAGSESNRFAANDYRHSGLLGFGDPTTPAGAFYAEEGTLGNLFAEVGHWPVGTNVCNMGQDDTDNPATPAYDGDNRIVRWDQLCAP